MIDCSEFMENIDKYIENKLNQRLKDEMEDHIKTCKQCKKLYKLNIEFENEVKRALNDLKLDDISPEIMGNINLNRYKSNIFNRLNFYMKKNAKSIACIAAALIIIISGTCYVKKYILPGNTSINANLPPVKNYSPVEKSYTLNEEILPQPDKISRSAVRRILSNLNKISLGVGPWRIGYSKNKKIIFTNYPALLAYSCDSGSGNYYDAIDLEKIDGTYYQGSVITNFSFSPDGNYVIINNGCAEVDIKDEFKMYLYNFKSHKLKVIGTENYFKISNSWSYASNYYAYAEKKNGIVKIFNMNSGTSCETKLNSGEINKIYVNDNGDAAINTVNGKNYMLYKSKGYVPLELNISGQIIGFDAYKSLIVFYDGNVERYKDGNITILKKLGKDFRLFSFPGYTIFSNDKITTAYDFKDTFSTFNFSYSDDFQNIGISPDFNKYLLVNNKNQLVLFTSSGECANLNYFDSNNLNMEFRWFDNDSIVMIRDKHDSQNSSIMDYEILKISIK